MIAGLWIFVGIVAGIFVQVIANAAVLKWQSNNAKKVLCCELEMNLDEIQKLKNHIERLKQKISANQVEQSDLWVNMVEFDYSALNPLVTSGHFHKMLGSDGVKKYLSGSRFFNNESAAHLTQMLLERHAQQDSLRFMGWLEDRVSEEEENFKAVKAMLNS